MKTFHTFSKIYISNSLIYTFIFKIKPNCNLNKYANRRFTVTSLKFTKKHFKQQTLYQCIELVFKK